MKQASFETHLRRMNHIADFLNDRNAKRAELKRDNGSRRDLLAAFDAETFELRRGVERAQESA